MRIYADGLGTVRGFFFFQQPSVDPGSPWTPLATSVALHPYGHAASFRSERLFRSFGVIGLRPALEVSVTRDITYVCFTTLVDALKILALTMDGCGGFHVSTRQICATPVQRWPDAPMQSHKNTLSYARAALNRGRGSFQLPLSGTAPTRNSTLARQTNVVLKLCSKHKYQSE